MHPNSDKQKTRQQIDWAVRAAEETRNRLAAAKPPRGRKARAPSSTRSVFEAPMESDLR